MSVPENSTMAMSVAVIGMAGRFPGARNVQELWSNLLAGRESVSPGEASDDLRSGQRFVDAGGVLEDIEMFDAGFFGFNPREAQLTDPQHRLLLECAYEALENAGRVPGPAGKVGVFVGASPSHYMQQVLAAPALLAGSDPMVVHIGNHRDFLATQLSYKLDLQGVSVNVATACSTSLVAIHLACKSLLICETDLVLAGGVSVRLPQRGYCYYPGGIHSPDGHCRAFDANAQGVVPGNGVGMVVLKRLRDALEDGDRIEAIVRGSAVNNDGAAKVGYTAPGVAGQAAVITEALAVANLDPAQIDYIECHGTGTDLGDALEIAALKDVFKDEGSGSRPRVLGAIKTNIGHLDAAAGVAGFIKVVLALRHGTIPPTANFTRPNPRLGLDGTAFSINSQPHAWQMSAEARRAGVSSFGIGGTNAHVVLEQFVPGPLATAKDPQVLVFSAQTPTALRDTCTNIASYLTEHRDTSLAALAWTLQCGRQQHRYRHAIVCESVAEACEALARGVAVDEPNGVSKQVVPVVLVFRGRATPDAAMITALHSSEPIFRQALAECDSISGGQPGELASFRIGYALARLWLSWGISPAAIMGTGVGRLVAGCIAGVLPVAVAVAVAAGKRQPDQVELCPPQISLLCASSGRLLSNEQVTSPGYWLAWRDESEAESLPVLDGSALVLDVGAVGLPGASGRGVDAPRVLREALAQLWSRGASINWSAVHRGVKYCKLALPTYPFQRQRYWVDAEQPAGDTPAPVSAHAGPTDSPRYVYRPVWIERTHVEPASRELNGEWLVFSPESGVASQLVGALRKSGRRCYQVSCGTSYERVARDHFRIDASSAQDYLRLLAEIKATSGAVTHVIHGWCDIAPGFAGKPDERIDAELRMGFQSVLHLLRALQGTMTAQPIALFVLTRHAVAITAAEMVCPERAAVLGACAAAAFEYSHVRCRHIDVLCSAASERHEAALMRKLLQELADVEQHGSVAYRDQQRWIRQYLPSDGSIVGGPHKLRERGVYLITGGLGRIGLELAEYLTRKARARICLLSRSPFPPRHEWHARLQDPEEGDPTAMKIRRLLAMEGQGAELAVVRADVGDREQVCAALAGLPREWGSLNGVFHLAADLGNEALTLIADSSSRPGVAHFRAKILGACVLEDVLRDQELDFCVLFSSLSAILGGVGHAAYSAANNCLDAFAVGSGSRGSAVPYLSIGWDGWDFTTAVSGAVADRTLLTPAEGIGILDRLLLGWTSPQVCISKTDLRSRIEQVDALNRTGPQSVSQTAYDRPAMRVPYVPPESEIDQTIVRIWQELLGIRQIGLDDDFFELGGDSLIAARMFARLRAEFAIETRLDSVFEQPTIRELSAYLCRNLLETTSHEMIDAALREIRARGEPGRGGG